MPASLPASTRASTRRSGLPATLFKVRAASLLSAATPDWCAGFLSGLLIGAEIGGQRDWIGAGEIPLIGGAGLCALYAQAFGDRGEVPHRRCHRRHARRPQGRAAAREAYRS